MADPGAAEMALSGAASSEPASTMVASLFIFMQQSPWWRG
jgi:hypothetical protein